MQVGMCRVSRQKRRVRRRRRTALLVCALMLTGGIAAFAANRLARTLDPTPEQTLNQAHLAALERSDAVEYGRSGAGRALKAYRFGDGQNVMVLTFAIHGYEDAFPADGAALVWTAHRLMDVLDGMGDALCEAGWTVWVLPCLNPDGLLDGHTNNGPGRCTTASYSENGTLLSVGVDMNRCFPALWEKQSGARNANGDAPLACVEAEALSVFLESTRGSGRNICIDVHGWYRQTITSDGRDGALFAAFQERFPDNTWADCRKGSGYLTAYAAALGYDACLFEFPGGSDCLESFQTGGDADRFIECVLELLGCSTQQEGRLNA